MEIESADSSSYAPKCPRHIIDNERNVVKPLSEVVIEKDTFVKGRGPFSFVINLPEPSKLLVFVVANSKIPKQFSWARKIIEYTFKLNSRFLAKHKVSVVVEKSLAPKGKKPLVHWTCEIDMLKVNVIVTVGSEGSIHWAHRHYKYGNIPPIVSFSTVFIEFYHRENPRSSHSLK